MKEVQPNITGSVPFFMVQSMERSLDFYVKGLGFSMAGSWAPRGRVEWCRLEREGVSFMLQEYRPDSALASKEKGAGTETCVQCRDALPLYDEFGGKGLRVSEPFVGNNLWVIQLTDPDGYRISFSSPTDVPEETKYSDWKS